MKKYISSAIEFLINVLYQFKSYLEKNSKVPNPNSFEDLAPNDNVDDDKYIECLKWALNNCKIKNIAITGPYGSGKSSILSTFKSKYKEFNFLNISLASFSEKEPNERLIERSILQQIFYGVKAKTIPDSRFKKIHSLNIRKLCITSFLLIVWLFSFILLFKPTILSSCDALKNMIPDKNYFYYTLFIIFILGIFVIIYRTLRFFNNVKFNKLNFKSGEIELNNNIDSSILNKHLDEIIYFFEVTRYNIVIIEDLDRFNTPNIFTKLREINLLINNSKQVNRRIVFIYAVKDDLFKDKHSRTKFFDFIIPVIPVVNSSNSEELLQKKLKETKLSGLISKNFISDISLYIEDMRVLKNIYNEFIIYKDKLGGINLNTEKLFSIIIYKNLYPSDFANLHSNKGIISELFENKPAMINKIKSKYDASLKFINNKIIELDNEKLCSIKELRQIYIANLSTKFDSISEIYLNDGSYKLDKLLEDNCFKKFKKQNNISYNTYSYYGRKNSNISFSQFDKEINPNSSYEEREQLIILKESNKIEKLKKEKESILEKLKFTKSLPLKQVLKELESDDDLTKSVRNERILYYLVRHGYIDEMYHSFISYFYEGSLSKTDMDFVFSVKDSNPLDFSHSLENIEELLKKLQVTEFSQESILNYDLLEFLINNEEKYKEEFESLITKISNESVKSIEFIDGYIDTTNKLESFIKSLCIKWPRIWNYIELESNFPFNKTNKYLKLILQHSNIEDIKLINKESKSRLKNYISNKASFLSIFSDTEDPQKLKDILSTLNIKFINLDVNSENNELFNYIYENNLYEINIHMISLMVKKQGMDISSSVCDFYKKNYTTIKYSDFVCLQEYIEENIETYISEVFLKIEKNIEESEEITIELLHNKLIKFDTKEKIIIKENLSISDITKLDNELWEILIQNTKVIPSWFNVIKYCEYKEEVDQNIIDYLNIPYNHPLISIDRFLCEPENQTELAEKISTDIILSTKLSEKSFSQIIESIPYIFSSLKFETLSKYKVSILTNSSFLSLTKANFELLKSNFSPLHISLLETNIKKFLENESEINIDEKDILLLLNSPQITISDKTTLINKIDEDVAINEELADLIISILLPIQPFAIDYEILLKLFTIGSSTKNKIELLNSQIDYYDNNHAYIASILNTLPTPYNNIAKNGSRPLLSDEKNNKKLVEKLMAINYISSFKYEKENIRVNTRRYQYEIY